MNPVSILLIIASAYWFYSAKQAKQDAEIKQVDDQTSTNPMVQDVIDLKNAINPSKVGWLNRFDEADTQEIFRILKKYSPKRYPQFSELFRMKYQVNLTELLTQKVFLSSTEMDTMLALVNGTITAQQQLPYTNYSGSIVPTGKTIKFTVPAYLYHSDDITEPPKVQLPDLNNVDDTRLFSAGEKTYTLKTTGRFVKNGSFFGADSLWAQLSTDDGAAVRWVLVVDNAASGMTLISYV